MSDDPYQKLAREIMTVAVAAGFENRTADGEAAYDLIRGALWIASKAAEEEMGPKDFRLDFRHN